jgi:hypothetical protein
VNLGPAKGIIATENRPSVSISSLGILSKWVYVL